MNDTELQLVLALAILALFPVLWLLDYLRKRPRPASPRYLVPVGHRWVDLERTPSVVLRHHREVQDILATLVAADAQLAVLDGTGVRCAAWQGHVWQLALDACAVVTVTTAVSTERERRARVVREGQEVPLLVVVVGSLTLLEGVMGTDRLRRWLQVELVAGSEVGMRFVVVADALPMGVRRLAWA